MIRENREKRKNIYKYLFVAAYILFFLYLNTPFTNFFFRDPDQGAQLAKAMEILNGIHPFIDIKGNIYGPLVFYMSALGQLLSGTRLIGEVILILSGYLVSYLLLFYLTEKISDKFYLSFILLTVSLTLLPRFYKYYIVLGPILFLFTIYKYFTQNKNERWIFFLGAGIGVNLLFRFDIGFYTLLTGVLALFIKNKKTDLRAIMRALKKLFMAVSGVVIPWIIFILIKGGSFQKFSELFSIVKGIGTRISLPLPVFDLSQQFYSDYNNFSLLFWLFRLLPFIVLLFLFLFRKEINKNERGIIFLFSVFAILIFVQALHRTDISHLLQVIPVSFILTGWFMSFFYLKRIKGGKEAKILISLFLILMFSGWIIFLYNKNFLQIYKKNLRVGLKNYGYFTKTIPELRREFRGNRFIKVADFVNRWTDKREPVFFFPIESQQYYFSERIFNTSLGILGPGRLNTVRLQELFFKELVESGTKVLVDRPFFSYDNIKNRNPRYYYPELMRLIYSEYRITAKIGDSLVLCNDDRFDRNFSKKVFKFRKHNAGNEILYGTDIKVSMDFINTFPAEEFDLKIFRGSILYIKGYLKGKSGRYKKENLYLGLKNEKEKYISRFWTGKSNKNNMAVFILISSLKNVNKGKYELFFLAKNNDLEIQDNLKIVLNVI
ncbi:MAG: hypothetical protein ABFR75_09905 [Acidobacteriota bacterium]